LVQEVHGFGGGFAGGKYYDSLFGVSIDQRVIHFLPPEMKS
jgi:hypothetical protein